MMKMNEEALAIHFGNGFVMRYWGIVIDDDTRRTTVERTHFECEMHCVSPTATPPFNSLRFTWIVLFEWKFLDSLSVESIVDFEISSTNLPIRL